MNIKRPLLAAAGLLGLAAHQLMGQGTAFTYQGRLDDGGAPANGLYDLSFALFGAATGSSAAGLQTFDNIGVTNGLFTVTLDYGASAFAGSPEWLEISVRPGASTGAYTTLAPRQSITPVPYAVYAGAASATGLRGTLPSSALAGAYGGVVNLSNKGNSFTGNGGGLTNLPAGNLAGTVADTQLSTNVALLNSVNRFTAASNIFGGGIEIGNGVAYGLHGDGGNLGLHATHQGNIYLTSVSGSGSIMVWDPNQGLLGLGTGSPAAPLDVYGQLQVLSNGSIVSIGPRNTFNGMIEAHYGDNDRYGLAQLPNGVTAIYSSLWYQPSSIQFGQMADANTFVSQMTINHAGYVGIGTVSPNNQLEVVNGAANVNAIAARQAGAGASAIYGQYTGPAGQGFAGFFDGALVVNGEVTCTALNVTSDRNAKEKFQPVSARDVLEKVVRLPITQWEYKTQSGTRHLGPMAQDFHEAFGLGHDEKHIATVDEEGVALAAIQGLNDKLDEQAREVRAKDRQIQDLEKSVVELKAMVNRLAGRDGGAQ